MLDNLDGQKNKEKLDKVKSNYWLEVWNFLSTLNSKEIIIKLLISSIMFLIGCFWQPIFGLLFLIITVFILAEKNINSLLYLLFFVPVLYLFKFNNEYGLTYWFVLVCIFVFVNFIKMLYDLKNKKIEINKSLIVIILTFAVYLTIPFSNKYKIISVLEAYVWLLLIYLVIANLKDINIKKQTLASSFGFLFSALIGCFVKVIPYLTESITLFYSGGLVRFSGGMTNPNLFYNWGLMCFALLITLIVNQKLRIYYIFLAGVVFLFSYLALSKTFFVIYIIMIFVIALASILKISKWRFRFLALIALITAVIAISFLGYTKEYLGRFTFSNNDSVITNTSENLKTDDSEINFDNLSTGRLELWKKYLNHQKESNKQFFGFGINTANGLVEQNTHSAYVQIFYELGLVGSVFLIVIGVYYLIKSKFIIIKKFTTLCWLPFMVLACSFVSENLFLSQVGTMMFLLAVIGLLVINGEKKDECVIELTNKQLPQKSGLENKINDESQMINKKLAIITPTYNRVKLINRCFESLKNQTNKNFVWYVVDDGSTDNTESVIREIIKNNIDIKIHYLKKENGGKHTALNKAIQSIKEEYLIILDSDDWFKEEAVETILKDLTLIDEREEFCGIGYLKENTDSNIVGTLYTEDGVEDTFINQRYNKQTIGDKAEVFKTAILKQFPFPEFKDERFLSEATVWCRMSGNYKMKFFNKSFYVCDYQQDGLSKDIKKRLFKNPQGAVVCYRELSTKEFRIKLRVKYTIAYIVYSLALGKSLKEIKSEHPQNKILIDILFIPSKIYFNKCKRRYL